MSEMCTWTPICHTLRKGFLVVPGSGDRERATMGIEELRGWTGVRGQLQQKDRGPQEEKEISNVNCADHRGVPMAPSHSADGLWSGGAVLKLQAPGPL